jgi:energy-converting hydrogenase Eha subunit B
MRKLIFAIAAVATLDFAAPVYAGTPDCSGCTAADGMGVAHAADRLTERGRYLVSIIPCTDCHTPGTLYGKPDMTKYLAGSDTGFFIPHLGFFYGANLTPDDETGLGKWTVEQIAQAITDGVDPTGRKLAPNMPSEVFHHMTKDDALAIATYLKTLPPVRNKITGPLGPTQKPTGYILKVTPVSDLP